MASVSHSTYLTITGVVYLGLITNLLLVAASAPLVVLLVTTDPALSWPLLAVVAPLCAPAVCGAFSAFREFGTGGTTPARAFYRGWKTSWGRALPLGAVLTVVLVVILVDVRFFSDSTLSVVVVPLLGVLAVVALGTGAVGLVAITDNPSTRLRHIMRAALYLSLRKWYLTVVTLLVLATQVALFAMMPAIALGLTAAPALYLAWANSRYTLTLSSQEVLAA